MRASSSKLATRLDAEIEASRVGGDVFEFSLLYLTTSLNSAARSCNTTHRNTPHYAKPYADPGYWAATGLSSIIILLNSRRVEAANVPKSWWDLTKPFWRNKLTIDNLEVSGTGYHWLVDVVNDQRLGWKYIEELGKNKPTLERGHAGMAQKVAAGEYFAAVEMTDFHLKNLRNASPTVPLLGVWPSEGVSREPWTAGILKRAQHPNAAKLYLDFLLSREGQELYVSADGMDLGAHRRGEPGFKEMPAEIKTISADISPEEALRCATRTSKSGSSSGTSAAAIGRARGGTKRPATVSRVDIEIDRRLSFLARGPPDFHRRAAHLHRLGDRAGLAGALSAGDPFPRQPSHRSADAARHIHAG